MAEALDDILSELDETFCFEQDISYKERAHAYIDRRDLMRSGRDTAVQCTVRDLVNRAYACGLSDGRVAGFGGSDAARETAMTLARASGEIFGLARDIMDCLEAS